MSDRGAVDHQVRHLAIHATDRSIALSAGAGSGKTSVLVNRVLVLLRQGVPAQRIAAITFTEKAAGELQARVRDGLEQALAETPGEDHLERALSQVSELVLSTIHSFCQRLLVSEALDAAWAPDTEVGHALFASVGFDAALQAWQRGFEARHPVAGLVLRSRVPSPSLVKAVHELVRYRDLEPVVAASPFDSEEFHDLIKRHGAVLDDALSLCLSPMTCKLVQKNRPLIDQLRWAAQEEDAEVAVIGVLQDEQAGNLKGGRAADWAGGGKSAFVEAVGAWRALRVQMYERLHGVVVTDICDELLPEIERAKAEHGRASFDDLLFRAAALLRDDAVRARVATRYDAILIDEVQDTDPIQAEIAVLLARSPAMSGPWHVEAPRPGHLFAVGDAKQSIYRFRRADVAVWDQLRGLLERNGEHLELRQNFRSVPGIVRWVNHVFGDMPGYVEQVPWRDPGELPPVVMLPTDGVDDEIAAVVAHLADLHEQGRGVVDRETRCLRPMRWDDVMILLPAWTRAEAVQRALIEAGIPSLVEGGGGFLKGDAIGLCLAAMKALSEPGDSESIVLVLRGFFGCSHDDLLRHVRAEGRWWYTLPEHPAGPVADAFAVLRELHYARGRSGWVALLDELLERSRAGVTWSLRRDGDARLANLDRLRMLIAQIEPDCPSPTDVVTRLETIAEDERDQDRADADTPMVRVTSYFKAKGLEAPIVALCCATRKHAAKAAVVDRANGRVALKVGSHLAPPGWDAVWKPLDAQEAAKERKRWMYVAATRARDQLVIAVGSKSELVRDHILGRHPAVASAAHEETLAVAEGAVTTVRWLAQLPRPGIHRHTFPGHDSHVDALLADPPAQVSSDDSAWRDARRDRIRSSVRACTRWRSVHEVATRERVRDKTDGGVGAAGGTLVHEVLEHLDIRLPRPEAVRIARDLAVKLRPGGMNDELFDACVGIVERILDHEVVGLARGAAEVWQEVPFVYDDRGRKVSGTIDLCFPLDPERRRWMVVDWKSDVPPRDSPAYRNYQRQLGLYMKALLATVGPCTDVEPRLVGPYAELGGATAAEHALEQVTSALKAPLEALFAEGVPIPSVGVDVGGDMVLCELAWMDTKVAVVLDPDQQEVDSLEREGWMVLAVDTGDLTWVEQLVTRIGAEQVL